MSSRFTRSVIRWYYRHWVVRYVLAPLAFSVPPLMLVTKDYVPELKSFFDGHAWLAMVAALWPALAAVAGRIGSRIESNVAPIGETRLMALFKIINHIVGQKITRFAENAKKLVLTSDVKPDGNLIFQTITQPDTQIESILYGVYLYYYAETCAEGIDVKVALAEMGEEHIDRFRCWLPGDDPPPPNMVAALQNEESGFSRAKKWRKIVVVQDYQKELKKPNKRRNFVVISEDKADENGSMICYPVVHPYFNEVPYVISICASKAGYFRVDKADGYDLVLSCFAKRISLEHGLRVLKEGSNSEGV